MGEILRVVGTHILRDAKLGAQEGGADLGHQFFGGPLGLAEALARGCGRGAMPWPVQ